MAWFIRESHSLFCDERALKCLIENVVRIWDIVTPALLSPIFLSWMIVNFEMLHNGRGRFISTMLREITKEWMKSFYKYLRILCTVICVQFLDGFFNHISWFNFMKIDDLYRWIKYHINMFTCTPILERQCI